MEIHEQGPCRGFHPNAGTSTKGTTLSLGKTLKPLAPVRDSNSYPVYNAETSHSHAVCLPFQQPALVEDRGLEPLTS